ncbi:hypothetical protein K456DRAFT_976211 [Colletotrichum gloeosporioides 23]|nr:hypothetical protein K456DRAFT_976211 [Colletotrichum gloeosporioides 23]
MTALFNFQSLLLVILLLVCTCAYIHQLIPAMMDRNKDGFMGIFWKFARVGERLSPYISLCCVVMANRSPCSSTKYIPRTITHDSARWGGGREKALVEETQEAQRSSHRRANIARVTIAIVQRTLCLESGRQSQG